MLAAAGMSDTIKTRHSSRLMMRFFMFFLLPFLSVCKFRYNQFYYTYEK